MKKWLASMWIRLRDWINAWLIGEPVVIGRLPSPLEPETPKQPPAPSDQTVDAFLASKVATTFWWTIPRLQNGEVDREALKRHLSSSQREW